VIDRIQDDDMSWEGYPLASLSNDGQLNAYKHDGFWQPMDTVRDKQVLESLWNEGKAPWKRW
jgi:glucose-1-phosphate cytidylyltransferase